ncbi:MAG: hypothetical protein WAV07_08050 [Candidatus Contendobacter sp.]
MRKDSELSEIIEKQAETLTLLQQGISVIGEKITALYASQQIIVELLMAADPKIKDYFAEALPQLLAKPERVQNNRHLLEIMEILEECSRLPSRTTPEGRRGWLYSVNKPDSIQPDKEDC